MAKKWYKSRAIWGAVVAALSAALIALGYSEAGQAVLALGTALGIVGLRLAREELK